MPTSPADAMPAPRVPRPRAAPLRALAALLGARAPRAESSRARTPRVETLASRAGTLASVALLLLGSACASDPAANDEPIAAEVFWIRSDERVGTIDHSLVSQSLPEAQHRRQVEAAVEMRRASRKTIPDWRMHQLLAAMEDHGFDDLAQSAAQSGAWDLVGVVRDGRTRVLSIFHSKSGRLSEDDHRRAREIYYLFQEVDNSTTGFQTQSELRPDDFQRQQEEIRRSHEEALRRRNRASGSGS
jgi:hypothetical protein